MSSVASLLDPQLADTAFCKCCPSTASCSPHAFLAGMIAAAMSTHDLRQTAGVLFEANHHTSTDTSTSEDQGQATILAEQRMVSASRTIDAAAYFTALVCHMRAHGAAGTLSTHVHHAFRWSHLYKKETESSWIENNVLLRSLFGHFADPDTERVTLASALAFCAILQFQPGGVYIRRRSSRSTRRRSRREKKEIAIPAASVKKATAPRPLDETKCALLFRWSLEQGETTLGFPGWVELMCRLALSVPLPETDDCLGERGSAFRFLEKRRSRGELASWEKANAVCWQTLQREEVGESSEHKDWLPVRSVANALPLFVELCDSKLRVARNIQHFFAKRFRQWKGRPKKD